MDTGSYKFKTLCQKYEDFRGPAFDITVTEQSWRASASRLRWMWSSAPTVRREDAIFRSKTSMTTSSPSG